MSVQPAKLELTWGTEKATLIQQPSGSGIRYSGDGVEYEEHQGQVHVNFNGQQLSAALTDFALQADDRDFWQRIALKYRS